MEAHNLIKQTAVVKTCLIDGADLPQFEMLPGEVEYWRGKQWLVSSYGLTASRRNVHVTAADLCDDWQYGPPDRYRCVLDEYAGYAWVDLDELTEAYLIALAVHGFPAPDPDDLALVLERCRLHRREAEAYRQRVQALAALTGSRYVWLTAEDGRRLGEAAVRDAAAAIH